MVKGGHSIVVIVGSGLMLVGIVWLLFSFFFEALELSVVEEGGRNLSPHEVSAFLSFDAAHDTVRLHEDEMQHVRLLHKRRVSYGNSGTGITPFVCPNRYIFVNTHTYGRHHNQLQEMMNVIMWAERLNRTAVLGWFRAKKRWIHASQLYNFSMIAQRYCLVSAGMVQERLRHKVPLGMLTLACYGQCVHDTPLRSFARQLRKLPDVERLPPYFSWKFFEPAVRCVTRALFMANADVVVLGGAYAFFLRSGLAEHAAIYALLEPTASVQRMVQEFLRHSFFPHDRYFGVHKRHREAMCQEEMDVLLSQLQQVIFLRKEREQLIRAQCNISVPYLEALQASLGLRPFSSPLFVAHDKQDSFTMQLLRSIGAHVYDRDNYALFKDCVSGLCSLAVDYFLLTNGKYFTGNVLSSMSQNVCFARLGKEKACHGTEPILLRLLARATSLM